MTLKRAKSMNTLPAIDDLTRRKRVLVARFQIPGDVVPWARAGGGKTTFKFTPKPQRDYQNVVRQEAAIAMTGKPVIDTPCEIVILGQWITPKSYSKKRVAQLNGWKDTKPDADNISKIIKDGMNGIVYSDDARVCNLHVYKRLGDRAFLLVEVYSVTG